MLSSYKRNNDNYNLTYTIGDFYYDYKKVGKYSRKEFIAVLARVLEILRDEIIENRVHFNMPHVRGKICIRKYKLNKRALNSHRIDWDKTKKLNRKIYHLNLHTDAYFFRWVWMRGPRITMAKNEIFYSFKPVRAATRGLAAHIKRCASDPEIKDYDVL